MLQHCVRLSCSHRPLHVTVIFWRSSFAKVAVYMYGLHRFNRWSLNTLPSFHVWYRCSLPNSSSWRPRWWNVQPLQETLWQTMTNCFDTWRYLALTLAWWLQYKLWDQLGGSHQRHSNSAHSTQGKSCLTLIEHIRTLTRLAVLLCKRWSYLLSFCHDGDTVIHERCCITCVR